MAGVATAIIVYIMEQPRQSPSQLNVLSVTTDINNGVPVSKPVKTHSFETSMPVQCEGLIFWYLPDRKLMGSASVPRRREMFKSM